jgi:RNA polymerase sigma-70 factor (sigma-E family)
MQDLSVPGRRGGVVATADAERADAFDALFFAHAARLVRLARLLGDDDPEDVVQESFCKLYAARSRLRGEDDTAVAYLNRIVVNEVRTRQRRRTVRRRDAHLLVEPAEHDPHATLGERSAVVAALERLPQRQREALVLRFWLDLPLHQIAEVMGVRLGTVKSQVSRGLDAVQAQLHEEHKGVER